MSAAGAFVAGLMALGVTLIVSGVAARRSSAGTSPVGPLMGATGVISPASPASRFGGPPPTRLGLRVASASVGLVAGFWLTGWVVMAAWWALAGWWLVGALGERKERDARLVRVEAIAAWTESVCDLCSASAGLQEALRQSVRVAPAVIRGEVTELGASLQREPVSVALARFGRSLGTAEADSVVVALIAASRQRSGSVAGLLRTSAVGARERATMLRQVEAGRSRVSGEANLVAGISGAMTLMLILTQRSFLEPYDGLAGQVALLIIGAMFAGSVAAMSRLSASGDAVRVVSDHTLVD